MSSSLHTTPSIDLEARLRRAVAQFRAGQLSTASEAIGTVIRDAGDAPTGGHAVIAWASYWAARCARRQDRSDDAMRQLYGGLAAARSSSDGRIECLLRAEVVHVLSALGQNDDALEQADAALQRATRLADAVGQAAAQEALASVYWMTEDWAFGLKAYETAIELATACGELELQVLSTLGLAATQEGVATLARQNGNTEAADAGARRSVALQRESAALAAQLGDRHLVMYSELNCGCSLHSLGALDEARAVFERCLADPAYESIHGNAMTMLGRIALDFGDAAAALALLQRALPMVEAMNKPFPLVAVLETLVDTHEALGDPAAALACMRRFHEVFVKNASERARMRAQALSVKYDTERALAVAEAQRERADRLERSNVDLASQSARHARASLEDALTGIANRRHFDEALHAQLGAGDRLAPCSVALLDVDHFKRVNDQFSHLVGDEVLRHLGELLAASCRRDDLAARYGGEEFVLLARTTRREEMRQMCERIRRAVEGHDWSAIRAGLQVTVSIGVAHHDEVDARGEAALEALMQRADARLYAAKAAGRNRLRDTDEPRAAG